MIHFSRLTPAVLALLLSAAGARAAPATTDEAQRLTTLFERYIGHATAGDAPRVTVVPDGDSYRASFDVQQMIKPLSSFGFSAEPASQSFRLTPNADGTWHVLSQAMPPITMHIKDQTIAMRSGPYSFEGTFDPKLGAFTTGRMTQDDATFDQASPTGSQHRRIRHLDGTQAAAAGAAGTTSIKGGYTLSDMSDAMTVTPPRPAASVAVAPSTPPFSISYTLPKSSVDVALDDLHMTSLLDIWAFLVAHPNHDALAAAQEDLRGLLRAALPLMSGLAESGSAENLALTTQLGPFSVQRSAASVVLSGLDGSGTLAIDWSFDGLKVPSQDLPPWAVGFLPTSLSLKPKLTGFHVGEMLREAVKDFDLRTAEPFTPDQQSTLGRLAWPGDGKLTIGKSRIASSLLDITLEGEGTVGAEPAGKLTVTALGLDKAITTLQQATASDPSAQQILAQFILAKNLAKPGPDGRYMWEIEAGSAGSVTVNGTPLQ